jgi:erythromycin esterase-like protein
MPFFGNLAFLLERRLRAAERRGAGRFLRAFEPLRFAIVAGLYPSHPSRQIGLTYTPHSYLRPLELSLLVEYSDVLFFHQFSPGVQAVEI